VRRREWWARRTLGVDGSVDGRMWVRVGGDRGIDVEVDSELLIK
jgi:hypothetical protein